jgi:hypothetical protein
VAHNEYIDGYELVSVAHDLIELRSMTTPDAQVWYRDSNSGSL